MGQNLKDAFRYIRDEKGSVAVEAVIIMPALAAMYCASFVWFDAFRNKTLAMKATYAISDIISRQETIDEPYLDGLQTTMDFLAHSYAEPKMRVSLIEYDLDVPEANKYRLVWSWSTNGKPKLTQTDLDSDTTWIPVMGDDETVVVTESFVFYQPVFRVGIADQVWENVMVTRPRFAPTLVKTDEPDPADTAGDIDNEGDGSSI
jgi:Flp pilus assembly protein TadG